MQLKRKTDLTDPSGVSQPPAKRRAGSPTATNQRWIFSRDQVVPQALRSKKISKCSLEFIDVGPWDSKDPNNNKRLNHCVIRLTLKHAPSEGTPYAPANTQSLLLDITTNPKYHDPKYKTEKSIPVETLLKTCTYDGPHRDALKIIDLPLNRDKTVRDFLHVIETSSLDSCEFIPKGDSLAGCRPSGQYVLSLIYKHVRAIRSHNQDQNQHNITIRWIPAHVGVSGNEFADGEAKSAALLGAGMGVATGADEPIIRLAAAAKRDVRQRTRERWEKQWERESTSGPTKRLVQAPNKKTLRLYEGLSKPQCAILIQMRTMRIGLRHFLFKKKAADSDKCSCGEGSQTPKHILLQCSLYKDLRRQFWMRLDKDEVEVETDYDKIMSHPQATRYVAKFMQQTGLLQQFRCVELEEDDELVGLAAMEGGAEDDGY